MTPPLSRSFFARAPELVAAELLGCTLVVQLVDGTVALRITETEAYGGVGDDAASHAYRGCRARSATMFGPPGRLYVYFTYGMHFCANVVAHRDTDRDADAVAGAVLLRAAEVTDGLHVVWRRREGAALLAERDLARGPARLTVAAGLNRTHDGLDLCAASVSEPKVPDVQFCTPTASLPSSAVRCGHRVGISREVERPWRFWIADDATVSGSRPRNGGAGAPSTAQQSPT